MVTVFICKDNFESIMSCIYDAWSSKLGHQNIQIQIEYEYNMQLFCDYRYTVSDLKKANKVIHTIKDKLSYRAYTMIYAASLSNNPKKADIIYRFLLLAFAHGNKVLEELQNPYVLPLFELQRKVWNEAHSFKEFVRFHVINENILFSEIEPKNNILTLIAPHFSDRLPSENWMIIDMIRNEAVVHPKDTAYYLTSLSATELDIIKESMTHDDPYIYLWKDFFNTIGIEQRKNDKCQRNFLPLWYRKNMTEFQ